MHVSIESDIRKFIEENFLFQMGTAELSASDSLLEAGVVDSTGVLELVGFLENTYRIQVEDSEIVPKNLDSIKSITEFVAGKLVLRQEAISGNA